MRAIFGKPVRKAFGEAMSRDLPQFVAEGGGRRGGRMYRWPFREGVDFFIKLQMGENSSHDCFTVELSCSPRDYAYGAYSSREEILRNGVGTLRLPSLYREEWRSRTPLDPSWCLLPKKSLTESMEAWHRLDFSQPLDSSLDIHGRPLSDGLAQVEIQVGDAIDRIKRFALPFFEEFVRVHHSKDR